jgi:hypothetical protein
VNRFKLFIVAALAAVAIGVGGMVAAPPASALPNRAECDELMRQSRIAKGVGAFFDAVGNWRYADMYWDRAWSILRAGADVLRDAGFPLVAARGCSPPASVPALAGGGVPSRATPART